MDKHEYKDMWVYAEVNDGKVHSVSLELLCEIRKLCDQSGDGLTAVYTGTLNAGELEKMEACGADKIIHVTGTGYEHYNTNAYSNMFVELSRKYKPSAVFIGATVNGRDFAPHFAAVLETGCTSDATELIYNPETEDIEFVEPAAGGKIMAVITIPVLRPQVGTIRPGTFNNAPTGERKAEVIEERIDFAVEGIRTQLLSYKADAYDASLVLTDVDTVICVGNGLVGEEHLAPYRELAELLGGKLGCTRPIVDREIMPYKLQIGQSGVMTKPKLYIAFGVSGAVNHVTGVSADCFVAVNSDPNAPVFNYCDYGIVGDMDDVCRQMIEAVKGV